MCIKRSTFHWLLPACCLFAGLLFASDLRLWCANSEKHIEAVYLRPLLGGVQVRDAAGKKHLIRFDELSGADLNFLALRVTPEVDVDVDYTTRQLPRTEWTRDDDYTTLYRFKVSIKKTSRLPYRGKLFAEVFVLGNERLVDSDSRLVLMSYHRNRVDLSGERSEAYEFSTPETLFNIYEARWIKLQSAMSRGKTYAGVIVTVLDPAGDLIACESELKEDWLTDDLSQTILNLRRLYQEHPGSFESRHFNTSFRKLEPPRIPWFQRDGHE